MAYQNRSNHTESQILAFAGIGRRFWALLIDGLVLSVPLYLMAFAMSNSFDRSVLNPEPPLDFIFHFFQVTVCWAYFFFFEISAFKATPGKLLLGIFIHYPEAGQSPFISTTIRYFAKVLSVFLFGAGCLFAFFTQRKQAFHDLVVNSVVLKK